MVTNIFWFICWNRWAKARSSTPGCWTNWRLRGNAVSPLILPCGNSKLISITSRSLTPQDTGISSRTWLQEHRRLVRNYPIYEEHPARCSSKHKFIFVNIFRQNVSYVDKIWLHCDRILFPLITDLSIFSLKQELLIKIHIKTS